MKRLQTDTAIDKRKTVIIIGGGFAGLNAAKVLAGRSDVRVILIDRRNHHLFQPLLYQVATAGLSPADIATPIRSIFRRAANISVHLGQVKAIHLANKRVQAEDRQLPFDYLVLACGVRDGYFGHPEWEEVAPGLKSLEGAIEIRRRLLRAFELAENELDPTKVGPLLTFVVVGGGPTGVEMAGAIADISRTVLYKDFRRINPARAHVILLEAGPRLLPAFPEGLSARAEKDLRELGVDVRTACPVSAIDAEGATAGGLRISAKTVLWAAGVQGVPLTKTLGVPLDKAGRIVVEPDLSIPGAPDCLAAGDIIHFEMASGQLLPGLAPAAIQAGRMAARNILASINGRRREPFHYFDKGMMATIGKRKAVAAMGRIQIGGYLAWHAWLFVHLLFLVGFRNRVSVLLQWVWNYIFSRRGARLITEHEWRED